MLQNPASVPPEPNTSSVLPTPLSCLVVSLDFELYWGVRHKRSISRYTGNLIGARKAIPAILGLFQEFHIHATWAVVGMLLCDNTSTLLQYLPATRPQYYNKALCPYDDLPPWNATDTDESIFFAPGLVRLIANTDGQEIGSHSFSHYYCLEPGQDRDMFGADLSAAMRIARYHNIRIRSLVFPKNQCRTDYLNICRKLGIVAYRGNPSSWLYAPAPDAKQGYIRRLGRLVDAYFPLTGSNCYSLSPTDANIPLNVRASRYLRPCSRALRLFEAFRLRRITHDLTIAAKKHLAYHLWWHPHNFGSNLDANMTFLRRVLTHYRRLHDEYGLESLNMGEVAQRVSQRKQNAYVVP